MKASSPNRVPQPRAKLYAAIAAILVLGLALWYFRSAPRAQTEPSVAQSALSERGPQATTPVAQPQNEPLVAQQPLNKAGKPEPASALQPSSPSALSAQPAPAAPVAQPPDAPSVALLSQSEVRATSRMYAAHASLRTPEVADPDSAANKQILQTMVLKALAQGPSQPAGQQVTSIK